MTIRCRLPVVLGFILAMVASCAVADEPDQDVTGEIVAYGLYDSDTLGAAPTTDESSGGVHLLGTPSLSTSARPTRFLVA